MKIEFKDYIVDSDDLCYTLFKKSIIKEGTFAGKKTNTENIGKERLDVVGYFRTLEQVLIALGEREVKACPDLETAIEKLNDIEREVMQIASKMSLRVKIVE